MIHALNTRKIQIRGGICKKYAWHLWHLQTNFSARVPLKSSKRNMFHAHSRSRTKENVERWKRENCSSNDIELQGRRKKWVRSRGNSLISENREQRTEDALARREMRNKAVNVSHAVRRLAGFRLYIYRFFCTDAATLCQRSWARVLLALNFNTSSHTIRWYEIADVKWKKKIIILIIYELHFSSLQNVLNVNFSCENRMNVVGW